MKKNIRDYIEREQDNIFRTVMLLLLATGVTLCTRTIVVNHRKKLNECSQVTYGHITKVNSGATGGTRYTGHFFDEKKSYIFTTLLSDDIIFSKGDSVKVKYYCKDPTVYEVVAKE